MMLRATPEGKRKLLATIFEKANTIFLRDEKNLILSRVSERTLCGSLYCLIKEELSRTPYNKYYVDLEYNRNNGKVKTIINDDFVVVTINCDLIIHSRGSVIEQDNLLALEMKKSSRPAMTKSKDRQRLIALTKSSYDGVWSNDGIALPEHVCGYLLGVYYEINNRDRIVYIEYYSEGRIEREYELRF